MAIIKMKKLSLICLRVDREKLMDQLQAMQCVEIIQQAFDPEDGIEALELRDDAAAIAERSVLLGAALHSLDQYAPVRKGMFVQRTRVNSDGVAKALTAQRDMLSTCREIAECEAELAEIRQRRVRLEAQIEQLDPLLGFDFPLEQVADTSTTQLVLGALPPARLAEVTVWAAQQDLVQLFEVGRTPDAAYLLVIGHKSIQDEVTALLSSVGFARVSLSYKNTPAQLVAGFKKEIADGETRRGELAARIAGYADLREAFQILLDLATLEAERVDASMRLHGTRDALIMMAWVPADRQEQLREACEAVSPCIDMAFSDPTEEDDVPAYMENNKLMTPYEAVTGMFSTPGKMDIDPSPHLMPFFVTFFGMMVSDAGYGIILSLAGFAGAYVLKLRGMMGQIAKILVIGGLLTTFWGALFGSWFGIEGIPAPLFVPMNEPMGMLVLCFSLGLIHILYGMIIKMVRAFRAGDWQTAVFDQIGWMTIILGLAAFAAATVLSVKPLDIIGGIVAIVGVSLVLLFAGREKKFGIGRIISGLGALYGVTSYLSDVLSYARLFAMGLATGVICMVFNTIAGLLLGHPIGFIFGIAVLLVGHVFNLAINALGAYVHSCRLQYIEFFGKFFEGGGRAFKPMMRNTRYVDFDSGAS